MNTDPTVLLVDDDQKMRESIEWMLRKEGISVEAYSTPNAFLDCYNPDRPGCLVLDSKLPGMTDVELRNALERLGGRHPFIVISDHDDVTSAVEAMRTGAFDCIPSPFSREVFLKRVRQAIDLDTKNREQRELQRDFRKRLQSLTPRECEILDLVVDGELTKNIARKLGIKPKTVEVHRSHITSKMGVNSTAQLVKTVVEQKHSDQGRSGFGT